MESLSRREVLAAASGILVAAKLPTIMEQDQKPPRLPDDLVRDFVGACHVKFDKAKEMLDEHPTLLNACWDWSNGDFELAIGAAGHVGSRDIAEMLIERGATTTLFVHAMMGDLAIVKAILDRQPHLIKSKGPHGWDLIHHAKQGEERSKEVLDYLQTLDKLV
jgi:hypothetical protein